MIEITQYKNAKKINENGDFDCEINHPIHGWIPFTANLSDIGSNIDVKKLHNKILNEKKFQDYTPPSETQINEQKAMIIRIERNRLLRDVVDPIVCNPFRWNDLTDKKKKEWEDYRKLLLDIPQQKGFPKAISYPKQPS